MAVKRCGILYQFLTFWKRVSLLAMASIFLFICLPFATGAGEDIFEDNSEHVRERPGWADLSDLELQQLLFDMYPSPKSDATEGRTTNHVVASCLVGGPQWSVPCASGLTIAAGG